MAGLKAGRRNFILSALAGAGALIAWRLWPEQGVWNPCLGPLPRRLLEHDLVRGAWEGIDPKLVWDAHAHLVGIGDTPSGIRINPNMGSVLHPREFGQRVPSFELFARMMGERGHEGRLFGDISAITQTRRARIALDRVLRTPEWHGRLLNGSDYPLPGLMPIFSLDYLVQAGFIDAGAVPVLSEIRRHNILVFDFVAKRLLRGGGKRLPASVFETRGFFDRFGAK